MTDTATKNYCLGYGRLVNAKGELPTDKHDYTFPLHSVGCNSLECTSCGVSVVSFAGFDSNTSAKRDFDELLNAPDPRTISQLTKGDGRFYRCKCMAHVELDDNPIERYRDDGRNLGAWQCAGHPPIGLPAIVAGIEVDPSKGNARQWVLAAIGEGDFAARARRLTGLFFRLANTAVEPKLIMAVAALVNDEDVNVRDQALAFYAAAPGVLGSERVGLWLAEKPEWFDGRIEGTDRDRHLFALTTIERTVEAGRPYEPPVQELMRREAVTATYASTLVQFMAEHDREWFFANVDKFPASVIDKVRQFINFYSSGEQRKAAEAKLVSAS